MDNVSLLLIIGAASSVCSLPPFGANQACSLSLFPLLSSALIASCTFLECHEATMHNELRPRKSVITHQVISLERKRVVLE